MICIYGFEHDKYELSCKPNRSHSFQIMNTACSCSKKLVDHAVNRSMADTRKRETADPSCSSIWHSQHSRASRQAQNSQFIFPLFAEMLRKLNGGKLMKMTQNM